MALRRFAVIGEVKKHALEVTTRYFDFCWRLLERSLFFMGGGALFLVGGWLLERKRRGALASRRNRLCDIAPAREILGGRRGFSDASFAANRQKFSEPLGQVVAIGKLEDRKGCIIAWHEAIR